MSKKTIGTWYVLGLVVAVLLIPGAYVIGTNNYNSAVQALEHDQHTLAQAQADPNQEAVLTLFQGQVRADQRQVDDSQRLQMFLLFLSPLPGGVCLFIAWLGALLNLSRAREWTWFVLTFFFSGIMLLVYLIAGPAPQKAGMSSPHQQPAVPQAAGGAPFLSQAALVSQPVSAIDILQQRYARGEIDTTTFEEMRARLEQSGPRLL